MYHDYGGRLTLEADLSDGAVSGIVNDLESRRTGEEHRSDMSADNRIDISGGEIADGRFVADWTGQGPEGGPAETVRGMEGQLLGEFYGPEAEEVAGVVNGRRAAAAADPAQIIHGHFTGSTDDGTYEVRGPAFSDLAPVHAQDDGRVLVDRTEAFGFQAVARIRDFRDAGSRLRDPIRTADVKSVSPDGSGGYRVVYVVDGREQEIHFGPTAPGSSAMPQTANGDEFNLYRWSDDFNGQHFSTLATWVNLCVDDDDYCETSLWPIFGQETQPERLQALGSASYSGEFYANVAPPHGGSSANWRRLAGDVSLDADFAGGSISGLIGDLEMQPSERESGLDDPPWADLPAGNSIVISGGRIADSRFTAAWAGQDADAMADPGRSMRGFSGEMTGAFYGPDGEEVAGAVGGGRGREWLVQGAFAGARDAPAAGN